MPGGPDQAVILHLPLSSEFGTSEEREAIYELETLLRPGAPRLGGDHAGHRFKDGEAITLTYGPDADALFDLISGYLVDIVIKPGAYAVKRYGPDDSTTRRTRVALDAAPQRSEGAAARTPNPRSFVSD
jgi:hypothetical protein